MPGPVCGIFNQGPVKKFNKSPIDPDHKFNRDHDRGEKFSGRVAVAIEIFRGRIRLKISRTVLLASACCCLTRDLLMEVVLVMGLIGGRHIFSADGPGSVERGGCIRRWVGMRAVFGSAGYVFAEWI